MINETTTGIDLDACALEPIHVPGLIQPHGLLLVIEPEQGNIVQASASAAELLGIALDELLGSPYHAVLNLPEQARPRPQPDDQQQHLVHNEVTFKRPGAASGRWAAAWHLYPQQWLVEIEPLEALLGDAVLHEAFPLLRRIERDADILDACQRAAQGLRGLLHFDRVMVYRFDQDWNGDVIAEACSREREPYLGLHYPASDIPPQARTLYLRNRVRQIVDVHYTPSPIVPSLHPRLGTAVDLSDVSLRSVSPLHLEYLVNMGVSATLVSSIVVNDTLWGLIACHHYRPMYCNHVMRDVADAVTRALSGRIGTLQAVAESRLESVLMTVREKLISDFNDTDKPAVEMLAEMAVDLLDVVDADGVAIFHGENIVRHGQLPSSDELLRIRAAIEATHLQAMREGTTGALHTEAIGDLFPALADLAPLAAGVIFVPLIPQSRSALLWTRREQIRTLNWAGNPHLSKLSDPAGSRLSPRKSFDAWQETVRGRSRSWSPQHLESARNLRVLIELMERKRYQQDFGLLEASLSRLRSGVAIIECSRVDAPARLVYANAALAQLTGFDAVELVGRELHELAEVDSSARRAQALEQIIRSGRAGTLALPLQRRDADALPQQFDLEPLPNHRGQPTHWLLQLRAVA